MGAYNFGPAIDGIIILFMILLVATPFFAAVAFFGWAVGFWVLGTILGLMILSWLLARILL
jgi:hypothetical protein